MKKKAPKKSASIQKSQPKEAPTSQTKKRKRKSCELVNKNSNEINLSVKKVKQQVEEETSSPAALFKVPDFDDEQLPAFVQNAAQKIKPKKTKAVSKTSVEFKTPSKTSLVTPKKRVSFSIGHNKVN